MRGGDKEAMHIEERPPAPSREAHLAMWVRRLLRLYPRAWRDRYADEVAAVLAEHRVTYWTALDLILGALDAHLHGDLLPRRLTSMAHRIRSSEIATFSAFVLFCIAWLLLRFVRDPLPVWEAAVAVHPELLVALTILDLAGVVATLAILVGGLPLLFSALAQSIAARRWKLLALFAVPLLAAGALLVVGFADIPWSSYQQPGTSGTPLPPLPIVLQLGLVILSLGAVGGSAAAIATAIGRSELSLNLLRFALLPARIITVALALGLLGAVVLTAFIFAEAPQVGTWPPLQVGVLLLMLAAVVLAGAALRRGIQAARGGQ
jgi:hypothetical protein